MRGADRGGERSADAAPAPSVTIIQVLQYSRNYNNPSVTMIRCSMMVNEDEVFGSGVDVDNGKRIVMIMNKMMKLTIIITVFGVGSKV